MDIKTFGMILFTWSKKPELENLFDRNVSKKLDSISIRFQNYIVSSIMEKILIGGLCHGNQIQRHKERANQYYSTEIMQLRLMIYACM